MPSKAGQSFVGELLHFHAVRLRITGSGNLQLSLHSLDDVHNSTLVPLPMQVVTNREPVTLANYIDQRGYLELRTTQMNEVFQLSKIVVFIRPVASGYPQ